VNASTHIRAAAVAAAEALARLSGQLGYPADAQAIARLSDIGAHQAGVVPVAEIEGKVCGWAHVLPQHHLEHDANAELAGLAADERVRGSGIGAAFLHTVEAWAREPGCAELIVRCNAIRGHAQRFCLREGHAEKKRQAIFVKPMV